MNRPQPVFPKNLMKSDSSIACDALELYWNVIHQTRNAFNRLKPAILAALAFGLSGGAFGEGTISVGATTSTARINIEVVIANVVALQVGSGGNTVDTLTWDSPIEVGGTQITLANQDWDGTTPDTTSPLPDGVTSSPDITLNGNGVRWRARVRVFALGGDVTITSSASNGDYLQSSGGDQISLSSIDVNSPAGLPHPDVLNGGSSTILPNGNGIVDRSGRWRYRLDTSSTLAAGTYQSTITYTATIL